MGARIGKESRKKDVILSERELLAFAHEYVKLLGLQDWDIVFEFGSIEELGGLGLAKWTIVTKAAIIKILHPAEYNNEYFGFDMEKTLVHELLHLKLGFLEPMDGDKEGRQYEDLHILIEDLARAIVTARRNGGSFKC